MVEPQLATTSTNRESQATDIVIRYANWSTVPGFLPTPVIDIALLTGIQLRMLKKLSDHYDVPFSENLVKSLLMSLIGGIVPTKFGFDYLAYALKAVPVVGSLLSLLYMPAFAWAVTFAVGKVFIQHFESGGTFLSFDPVAAREHFQRTLKREYAAGTKDTELATEPKAAAAPAAPDDLTHIEGIGPQIARLLQSQGITTFSGLAQTPVEQLRRMLNEADLRMIDPGTWPEQAGLAAAGHWDELDKLQQQLNAGRRT